MPQIFHTDSIILQADSLNIPVNDSLGQNPNIEIGLYSDSVMLSPDSFPIKNNVKTIFTSHELAVNEILPQDAEPFNIDWITVHLMLAFGLLAWVRFFYRKRLRLIFKAFFNNGNFGQLSREGNLFKERISIPLLIIYLISISMFIYRLVVWFDFFPLAGYKSLKLFSVIFLGVSFYWVLKYFLGVFIGHVFKNYQITYEYQVTNFVFTHVLGIVMLPIVVVIVYFPSNAIVYFGLIVIAVSFLYRIGIESFKGFFYINFSVFYKLLYLCTLEILPVIIFIKLVMRALI